MANTATPAETMAPPATGSFCWYELHTRYVAAVQKFYGELCGWTTSPSKLPGSPYHHWHDKHGAMFGGIMDMNSPQFDNVPSHWMSYVRVADVDANAKRCTQLGGSVCVPPMDIPTVGRFCVINDPTGAAVALISLSHPQPIAPVMDWNELMTRDAGKARDFYAKLLGWTMGTMPMPSGIDYVLCHNAGEMIGGIFQMRGEQFEHVPPHWLNYIRTAQINADAAKLQKLGGTIVVPPTDIPNNIGRYCIFSDPGGGHIALYQGASG